MERLPSALAVDLARNLFSRLAENGRVAGELVEGRGDGQARLARSVAALAVFREKPKVLVVFQTVSDVRQANASDGSVLARVEEDAVAVEPTVTRARRS